MPTKKILLIYNPKAGGLQPTTATIQRLVAALQVKGIELPAEQIIATQCSGDATRLAQQAVSQQAELLIVCGGDGTVNEAAQALIGTKTKLAIFPAGTANVLAKELKLPRSPEKLATLIASDSTREISVGLASKPDKVGSVIFC